MKKLILTAIILITIGCGGKVDSIGMIGPDNLDARCADGFEYIMIDGQASPIFDENGDSIPCNWED